jgi:hypothetical protein
VGHCGAGEALDRCSEGARAAGDGEQCGRTNLNYTGSSTRVLS